MKDQFTRCGASPLCLVPFFGGEFCGTSANELNHDTKFVDRDLAFFNSAVTNCMTLARLAAIDDR